MEIACLVCRHDKQHSVQGQMTLFQLKIFAVFRYVWEGVSQTFIREGSKEIYIYSFQLGILDKSYLEVLNTFQDGTHKAR